MFIWNQSIIYHFILVTTGSVEMLGDVVMVACGQNHSLALCASGTVISWGANEDGQLGIPPDQERDGDRVRQDHLLNEELEWWMMHNWA